MINGKSCFLQPELLTGQAECLYLLEVLDERSFSHVNGQLAYIGHVIANSLEVFGHEKQPRVARGGGRLSHHHFNQADERCGCRVR